MVEDFNTSDEELKQILRDLKVRKDSADGSDNGPRRASWEKGRSAARRSSLIQMPRPLLISTLFSALSGEKKDLIGSAELRQFAELSGFDGDDKDWDDEYSSLCEENGWKEKGDSISLEQFTKCVDEYSTTDEALRSMILEVDSKRRSSQSSATDSDRNLSKKSELSKKLFAALDWDGKQEGVLSSSEMLRYAQLCGFEGSEDEWSQEFRDMCEEHGWNAEVGVSESQFIKYIEADEDNTEAELEELIEQLN
eukprot:TRINITY_DN64069_c0_g1_i1.p1 TRINITY_DN64069_c0_g1~~TRINITY_DN64069_c0_g1_i1.p1  ORF type:complete len:293 (+),score=84.98 TRINITY_DN64069_c0_g1_i1:124-879(+)